MDDSDRMQVLYRRGYLHDVVSHVDGEQLLACDETAKRTVAHVHLDADAAAAFETREQFYGMSRTLRAGI